MSQILDFPGRLPGAAPAEFAAAFLSSLEDDDEDEYRVRQKRRRSFAMSRVDNPFVLGRCGIGVFTEVLQAAPATGVSLIGTLVERTCLPEEGVSDFSVEHWAHRRLDEGETLNAVIEDIIGEEPIFGALWLVIVDLILSHSPLNGAILGDILVSPETLALDAGRANLDMVDRMGGGLLGHGWREVPATDKAVEEDLASRYSRSLALHDVIPQLVFNLSDKELGALRERLKAATGRLGLWTQNVVDRASPEFMASHAFRLASRENYELITEKEAASEERNGWAYKWPPGQKKWLEEGAAKASAEQSTFSRSLAVRIAMDDETKPVNISFTDAEAFLDETASASPDEADEASRDPNDPWLARVSAAAFLARLSSPEVLAQRRSEITSIFDQALQSRDQSRSLPRDDVMYDPHAMAIAGRLYLAATTGDEAEPLVQCVAEFPASAAPAFLRHRGTLDKIDKKLLISICRVALLACVIPRRANYDEDEAAYDKRCADLKSRLASP